MSPKQPPVAYAALARKAGQIHLHLLPPQGEAVTWSLRGKADTVRRMKALRGFIDACGEAHVVSFEAEELAELLSAPEILASARKTLGRLVDLRELCAIAMPLAPRYSPDALCPARDGTDPPDVLARCAQIHAQAKGLFGRFPDELMGALAPLLSQELAYADLDWVSDGHAATLMSIADALPKLPPKRKREPTAEDLQGDTREIVARILSPGGQMEDVLSGYEHRAGQVEMAEEVADALRDSRFLLVEAGTGVGKSFAYLIPAIVSARRSGSPVVVSTNTKNLQEQLIDKDLPLLRKAMQVDFEAALLKGRGNYPCVRTLVSLAADAVGSLMRSERIAAAYVISWLANCPGGDIVRVSPHALEFLPGLSPLLERVRSKAESCLGRACSYFDSCPVQIARAWARRADVIVSNHALTLEDTKAPILPEYEHLIFDEAQNLESVATDNLSLEFSRFILQRIERDLVGDGGGLIGSTSKKLQEVSGSPTIAPAVDALEAVSPALEQFVSAAEQFGEMVYDFAFLADRDGGRRQERATVRLVQQVRELPEWGQVLSLGIVTAEHGAALLNALRAVCALLQDVDKGAVPGAEGMVAEVESVITHLSDALGALTTILQTPGDTLEFVTWADAWQARRSAAWSLKAAPVDVGPVLDEALYAKKQSIVFTSATITVDAGFGYFRNRLGLEDHHERLVEVAVPSPFDLTEQLLLCIPTDMPDASAPNFETSVTDALGHICRVTEGGTLALFTARSRMESAYHALKEDFLAEDLELLCQDVTGPRHALLDRLKANPRAVLFGLKSFWEGIDVPGDALRCVVICKLPFAVPSDPIIQARQEDAARKGLDPMNDYYIPEAIVGFKQGFGRLIRTTTDTGVVFVLDRRILTKWYGRRFFRSIQRCELAREPLEDCIDRAAGWLGRH